MTRTGPAADDRVALVTGALRSWQRQLVDLGGPNTLLWYQQNALGTLELTGGHPTGVATLLAGRPTKLSDMVREPRAFIEAATRARAIRAKALELRTERGIPTLFLAAGMATWDLPGAGWRRPFAPVLLRPLELRPRDATLTDFDLDVDENVEVNPALLQFLQVEHGLTLDPVAIAESAQTARGFDPVPAWEALLDAAAGVPGFTIARRLFIGTFSYAKLPLVTDLMAQRGQLDRHPLVAALAGDDSARELVAQPLPASHPDGDLSRELIVVDADAAQLAAVDAARSGANLVIAGAPGTGKSQTLANVVAGLAADGKRVLFLAEKRSAIDAVVGRLEGVELGGIVLDLHDGVTTRSTLARDIVESADRLCRVGAPHTADADRALSARRDALIGHRDALHAQREPWGVSTFAAQNAIAQLAGMTPPPVSRVRVRGQALAGLTPPQVERAAAALERAATAGAWTGRHDPWFGASVYTTDQARQALTTAQRLVSHAGIDHVQRLGAAVLAAANLPAAQTFSDFGDALDLLLGVESTLEVFSPEVYAAPLEDWVASLAGDNRREAAGDRGIFGGYEKRRAARGLLLPGASVDDLPGALAAALDERDRWRRKAGPSAIPTAPGGIAEFASAYQRNAADLATLDGKLTNTFAGGRLAQAPLRQLRARIDQLVRAADRLEVVPAVAADLDLARSAGLGELIGDLAGRGVPPAGVRHEVDYVWWTSVLDEITIRDTRYGGQSGEHLHRMTSEYQVLDHEHLRLNAHRVLSGVAQRVRAVVADAPEQVAVLRAEASKPSRHTRALDLFPLAGDVMTAARPIWAMSPLVVPALIPPGQWFDAIVVDEASQVPAAQLISALTRAGQVIVAGDEHQLPPTSFSTQALPDAAVVDDLIDLADGPESVLVSLSQLVPVVTLPHHYRSHDERLVTFVNERLYDGAMVTFPGPHGRSPVTIETVHPDVASTTVDTAHGEHAPVSSAAEVDRVVRLVLAHARTRPHESLGVVTIGVVHARRVEEAIRVALLRLEPDADVLRFFSGTADREPFFVRNVERVQGDERDAIIFSVGYPRLPDGRVPHLFGPLHATGGDRRLGVAVTRARKHLTVVSSFGSTDLEPRRIISRGAEMLRDYLAYAESEVAWAVSAEHFDDDPIDAAWHDPLLRDLTERLRAAGHVVEPAVGRTAGQIELVVYDANRPDGAKVAVETDGAPYARRLGVRDRERLRSEHLARLGWIPLRVWQSDLFRTPEREVARILEAASGAVREPGTGAPLPFASSAPFLPRDDLR